MENLNKVLIDWNDVRKSIGNTLYICFPWGIQVSDYGENGYIDVLGDGSIALLPPGREIAEKLFNRHTILTEYLRGLGVSEETAAEDACKIEHIISEESFEAIKASLTK